MTGLQFRAFFDLHTIKAALWPWNILGTANLGLGKKSSFQSEHFRPIIQTVSSEMSAKRARNQLFSREYYVCTKLK